MDAAGHRPSRATGAAGGRGTGGPRRRSSAGGKTRSVIGWPPSAWMRSWMSGAAETRRRRPSKEAGARSRLQPATAAPPGVADAAGRPRLLLPWCWCWRCDSVLLLVLAVIWAPPLHAAHARRPNPNFSPPPDPPSQRAAANARKGRTKKAEKQAAGQGAVAGGERRPSCAWLRGGFQSKGSKGNEEDDWDRKRERAPSVEANRLGGGRRGQELMGPAEETP